MPKCNSLRRLYCRVVKCGLAALMVIAAGEQGVFAQDGNPFTNYLFGQGSTELPESKERGDAYEKLYEAIPSMQPADIAEGIAAIDRKLDNPADPANPYPQRQAAGFLAVIASRPDAWELLSTQIARLTSMMKGTDDVLGLLALRTFRVLAMRWPTSILPILEDALKEPDINKSAVGGAGIATFLLWTGRNHEETTAHVVEYMQRPELTDAQMVAVIRGITQTAYMTPALANELVRCLDRRDDLLKAAILALIEKGGPTAKDAARARVQQMANDPKESPELRQSAAAVLRSKPVSPSTGAQTPSQ